MNSKLLATIAFIPLIMLAIFIYCYPPERFVHSNNHAFTKAPEEISKDLLGFSIVLPFGQIWGFDASQKVDLEIINTTKKDNFVFLVANLQVKATTPAVEKNPAVDVQLAGVIKISYEWLADNWYIRNVESIKVKATIQEKK